MKIIAMQGSALFLVDVGAGMCRIVNWTEQTVSPPTSRVSVLARGYWEVYDGPQALLKEFEEMINTPREEE